MVKSLGVLAIIWVLLALTGCSRRMHPEKNRQAWVEYEVTPIGTMAVPESKPTPMAEYHKPLVTAPSPALQNEEIPKVITVNDRAAHRSVDGRYYYDVDGHRYWRNKYDGKYYLFNKSMFSDDAFSPPKKKKP